MACPLETLVIVYQVLAKFSMKRLMCEILFLYSFVCLGCSVHGLSLTKKRIGQDRLPWTSFILALQTELRIISWSTADLATVSYCGVWSIGWTTCLLWGGPLFKMTSSNENIFRVTGHVWGEFPGHRWIPRTKASDAELWCSLWSASDKPLGKQSCGWWFETLSRPLWRHCSVRFVLLNDIWCVSLT